MFDRTVILRCVYHKIPHQNLHVYSFRSTNSKSWMSLSESFHGLTQPCQANAMTYWSRWWLRFPVTLVVSFSCFFISSDGTVFPKWIQLSYAIFPCMIILWSNSMLNKLYNWYNIIKFLWTNYPAMPSDILGGRGLLWFLKCRCQLFSE